MSISAPMNIKPEMDLATVARLGGSLTITEQVKKAVVAYLIAHLKTPHSGECDLALGPPRGGAIATFAGGLYGVSAADVKRGGSHQWERCMTAAEAVSPVFHDAVWLLCLANVLRPGPARGMLTAAPELLPYSLTRYGREWVKQAGDEEQAALVAQIG